MIKYKNEAYKKILALVKNFVASGNFREFGVRQAEQPLIQAMNTPVITLFNVYNKRKSWQYQRAFVNRWGQYKQEECYNIDMCIQFSFFKNRNPADANETTTSDCADALLTYFNSEIGRKEMSWSNIQMLQTFNISETVYEDSSNNHQIMSRFDAIFVFEQSIDRGILSISKFDINIENDDEKQLKNLINENLTTSNLTI